MDKVLRNDIINISVVTLEQAARVLLNLLVFIILARSVGPEMMGNLSLAQALAAVAVSFSILGMRDIAVRDLAVGKKNSADILGATLPAQTIASIILSICVVAVACALYSDKPIVIIFAAIYILQILPSSFQSLKYPFEAEINNLPIVKGRLYVLCIFTVIKVFLILEGFSVETIVLSFALEYVLNCTVLIFLFRKNYYPLAKIRSSALGARDMLRRSWPLWLSSMASIIYMRIDQLMLGYYMDSEAVGSYAVAVRISELIFTMANLGVAVMLPRLIKVRENSKLVYMERLQGLFRLAAPIGYAIFMLAYFYGGSLIYFAFGEGYGQAVNALIILSASSIFVFLGLISGIFLISEGLQVLAFYRTLAGVTVNILLNLVLIPQYGLVGAAMASLVAQLVATLLADLFFKPTRKIFQRKLCAMIFLGRVDFETP